MNPSPYYHQGRAHYRRAAKLEGFAALATLLSYIMVGLGGLLALITAVLIITSSSINPWCFGALAVLMLVQVPLFALLGAMLDKAAKGEYSQERSCRQRAALHGETPWLQPDALD